MNHVGFMVMIQSDLHGDMQRQAEKSNDLSRNELLVTDCQLLVALLRSNKRAQIVTEEPNGRLGPDGNRTDSAKA